MTASTAQIRKAAHRLLAQVEPDIAADHVNDVLDGCAGHLVELFQLQPELAEAHAISAWSEIEGRRTACYIDLDLSTPYLVYVVDPVAKVRHPVPLVDLVRMLGPRAVA